MLTMTSSSSAAAVTSSSPSAVAALSGGAAVRPPAPLDGEERKAVLGQPAGGCRRIAGCSSL